MRDVSVSARLWSSTDLTKQWFIKSSFLYCVPWRAFPRVCERSWVMLALCKYVDCNLWLQSSIPSTITASSTPASPRGAVVHETVAGLSTYGEGWNAVTWCGWGRLKKMAQLLKIKARVCSVWAKGCTVDNSVCIIWLAMTAQSLMEGRMSWFIIIIIIIIISCVTSLDSSKPIKKRISVNHEGMYLLLHSRNNSSRKEHAWTRNKVHWGIKETHKRTVISCDWSLGREQKKILRINRRRAC